MGDTGKRKVRKRRARTAHTGVKLKQLAIGTWVARWRDPLSGAETQQSLDKLGLTTAETRRQWAIEKAESLRRAAAAIAAGSAVAERTTLAEAIKRYTEAATIKPTTLANYRPSLRRLQTWAHGVGVRLVQDLRPTHLSAFRDTIVKLQVSAPVKGGKRGRKQEGHRPRSSASTKNTLTVTKVFLGWARRAGLTPYLDGDAIRDRLRPVRVEREAVEFLRPPEVRQLLDAALRHDAATFALTRAEHDGEREPGTTPRYEPAAPLVLLAVLLGCRAMELVELEWREVDLQAGEIRLPASRTKTSYARTITLAESPSAIELLRALRLRTPGDRVFPRWTEGLAKDTRLRLVAEFGAPRFTWQMLRRTCAAVLTNAPAIYGGASAYRSAKRAGHSVAVAEKNYVDLLRDLPKDAATIEAATGIEAQVAKILAAAGGSVCAADGPIAADG